MEGLQLLKRLKLSFKIFCVVHRYNHRELEELVESACRFGAYKIDFNAYGRMGRASRFADDFELEPEDHVGVIREVRRLSKTYGDFISGYYKLDITRLH